MTAGWEDTILTRIVDADREAGRPVARSRWAPTDCRCPWPWPLDGNHAYVDCPHYAAPLPTPVAPFLEGCRQIGATWIHGRPHDCPKRVRQ